jgi:hypothetical protein
MVVLPGQVLELRSGTGRRGEVCAPRPGQKVTCNATPGNNETSVIAITSRTLRSVLVTGYPRGFPKLP